jgi:predicted translin family RNA/ssDNA-binding protein
VLSFSKAALILTTAQVEFSCAAAFSSMTKPSRPFQYKPAKEIVFDLTDLGCQVARADDMRQSAYEATRQLQIALQQARTALDSSDEEHTDESKALDALVLSLVPSPAPRTPREANFSHRIEEYVRFKALAFFLETGQLLPPSTCAYATDEEWLAGACMGLSQDLQSYGLGRATARDVDSVAMARNLVQEILNQLLQFDFRNGPLRRKYDGTKYALKTLETILYELSVTGTPVDDQEEPEAKRIRIESLVPKEELEGLRKRMDHRDELREALIKKCRDGQKAAKQSIFALHRGDKKKASALLQECEACIQNDLLPIVEEEPPLRSGSFSNVMEEYAEAKLFYAWLYGKEGSEVAPTGDMLLLKDFPISLDADEYLGGICDLTGEVGRFAVERGTSRDIDSVKLARHTCGLILSALQTMKKTPGSINKKMDQNRRSVEKLERMLYEMSLSEATGRKVQTSTEAMETEGAMDE